MHSVQSKPTETKQDHHQKRFVVVVGGNLDRDHDTLLVTLIGWSLCTVFSWPKERRRSKKKNVENNNMHCMKEYFMGYDLRSDMLCSGRCNSGLFLKV